MIKDDKIIIIIKHQEKHRFWNKIDLSLKSSFSSCHLGDLGKKYLTSLIVTLLILKGSDITVFCKGAVWNVMVYIKHLKPIIGSSVYWPQFPHL